MAANQVLRAVRNNNQAQEGEVVQDFPMLLKRSFKQIAAALPKHLRAERMERISLTEYRKNPKLKDCDPMSIISAVIQSAQLGLEPGMLGRSYLVPYKKNTKVNGQWVTSWECQFIPGWRGLVDLVARAGQATVWTGAVYAGDTFEFQLGDSPMCSHIPGDYYGEGEPTHVYACGKVKGADMTLSEVWSIAKVKRHLGKYNKVGDSHYGHENPEMYGRKVALLQILKYMPMSTEMSTTLELDQAAAQGNQNLNVDDAIAGEYHAVPTSTEEQVDQGTGEIKPASQQQAEAKPKERAVKTNEQKAQSNPTLEKAIQTLMSAGSLEELDELFIRSEIEFSGVELETLNRAYRTAKETIESGNGSTLF